MTDCLTHDRIKGLHRFHREIPVVLAFGLSLGPMNTSAEAQTAEIPNECSAYLTVQTRSCRVLHFMTCTDLSSGQYRVDRYDAEGIGSAALYDRQMNALVVILPREGAILRQDPASPDPLSMDELIETGKDTYDATRMINESVPLRLKGFDLLTEESVVIDGRTLKVTEFNLRETGPNGEVYGHTAGRQYLDTSLRYIFGGIYRDQTDAGAPDQDTTPVDFIYPGDDGFLATEPRFDCAQSLASLTPEEALR